MKIKTSFQPVDTEQIGIDDGITGISDDGSIVWNESPVGAAVVLNVKESFSCMDDGKFYCRAEEGAALASVVMWEMLLLEMQNLSLMDSLK